MDLTGDSNSLYTVCRNNDNTLYKNESDEFVEKQTFNDYSAWNYAGAISDDK